MMCCSGKLADCVVSSVMTAAAQHKRASIRGAALFVEIIKPFGRGGYGCARLTVATDGRDWVRGSAERVLGTKDVAGVFVFDDQQPIQFETGAVPQPRLAFVTQSDWNKKQSGDLGRLYAEHQDREDAKVKTLIAALKQHDGANTTELLKLTGWGNKCTVKQAAELAAQLRLIEIRKGGKGKPTTHWLVEVEESNR